MQKLTNLNIKRFLHVIYFFEDAKTKSFRLSLRGVKIIIAAAIILAIWTGSSIYMIAQLTSNQVELRQKLVEAKDKIFEYQVAYDDVFERAYQQLPPQNKPQPEPTKPSQKAPLISEHPTVSPEEMPAVSNEQKLAAKTAPQPAVIASTNAPAAAAAAAVETKVPETIDSNSFNIDIDNLQFSHNPLGLNFKFRIKNSSNEKANGYIWASASIKDLATQEVIQLGDPDGILLAEKNLDLIKSRATRFGIMRYKARSFTFIVPQGIKQAEFEAISIKVLDPAGRIQTHRINVPTDYRLVTIGSQINSQRSPGELSQNNLNSPEKSATAEDEEAEDIEDDVQTPKSPPELPKTNQASPSNTRR